MRYTSRAAAFARVAEDKKALEDVLAKMVKSDAWKKLLEQREWVDLYMPRRSRSRPLLRRSRSASERS